MARSSSPSFQRPSRQRFIGRRIIVSCEGEKTEYEYFQDIRKSMRMEPDKIIVLNADGTDPVSVVRSALEERKERQRIRQWTEEDSAWAVFDGDEHRNNNLTNWNDALNLARGNHIEIAVTNPSFEYWYLLHYQSQAGFLTRQRAMQMLKSHLPNYEKSDIIYQAHLHNRTKNAIDRARQLSHLAEVNDQSLFDNPCCHVWRLVELILSLQNEG